MNLFGRFKCSRKAALDEATKDLCVAQKEAQFVINQLLIVLNVPKQIKMDDSNAGSSLMAFRVIK